MSAVTHTVIRVLIDVISRYMLRFEGLGVNSLCEDALHCFHGNVYAPFAHMFRFARLIHLLCMHCTSGMIRMLCHTKARPPVWVTATDQPA